MGLKHLTGDIKRMLARIMSIDQNNYPEMLGHTCIINAPGVFKLVWSAIKGFIDPKTQEKIEVTALAHPAGLATVLSDHDTACGTAQRLEQLQASGCSSMCVGGCMPSAFLACRCALPTTQRCCCNG